MSDEPVGVSVVSTRDLDRWDRMRDAAPEMYALLKRLAKDVPQLIQPERIAVDAHALLARIDGKEQVRTCWEKTAGSSRFCGLAAGHPGPHVWQDEEPPNTIDGKEPG